jgi:hypothetical protein
MPPFLHPALFWTLGLPTLGVVAIPVLIHLINMMRHRRVPWAAMEFLLLSQKKNRTWVMLKQLLLLLLRMLAVTAIVLLVAQPVLRNEWGNLLGGTRTHHIILLDDSFSMSDRWEDTDAFAEAKKVVQRIGDEAARQAHPQALTLLRFSRVGRFQRAAEPDLLKQTVGGELPDKLTELLAKMKVTQTAAGPMPALQAVGQLLGQNDGERRIVYLLSDFRARQWDRPTQLRTELLQMNAAGAEIHLVNCIDRARPNLAIASLAPADGIRAAGVPWFMEVGVQNFGPAPVRNVSVILGEDGHARPSVTLTEIPPGKMVKERFPVHFPNAGRHEITARLESDAVAADNYRYCSIDLPPDAPVLLVDGDAEARDARFLSWALAPGGAVRTGIRPQIETPRYLSLKPLGGYLAVNLTNIERLDASAVAALEKYVAGGGGVVFFLGERAEAKYFNDVLYRDGKGLFPVPLANRAELAIDRLEPAPDVQAEPHFIFRIFSGKRNSFLQTVAVERYFALPQGWRPPTDSTVRVAARLRNGAPLVVERSFGKGRVVAFLTTAAPTWNNWARNPSFVVVIQDLQAYLSQRSGDAEQSRLVASPLELRLDPAIYQPQVRFMTPETGAGATTAQNAAVTADGSLAAVLQDTDLSGFYEARLTRTNGATETRRYALNVDPAEGDLSAMGPEQLAARLDGIKYQYAQAAAFQSTAGELAGYNLGEAILYGLVLLLIVEQILAWSASYHPPGRRSLAQGGVS